MRSIVSRVVKLELYRARTGPIDSWPDEKLDARIRCLQSRLGLPEPDRIREGEELRALMAEMSKPETKTAKPNG